MKEILYQDDQMTVYRLTQGDGSQFIVIERQTPEGVLSISVPVRPPNGTVPPV